MAKNYSYDLADYCRSRKTRTDARRRAAIKRYERRAARRLASSFC